MSSLDRLPLEKPKPKPTSSASRTPAPTGRAAPSAREVKQREEKRKDSDDDGSDKESDKGLVRELIGEERGQENENDEPLIVPADMAADFRAYLDARAPKVQHASSASAPLSGGFASRLRERVAPAAQVAPRRSRPAPAASRDLYDDDADEDHGGPRYAGGGSVRLAPMVIERALSTASSVLGWVIAHEWKMVRNRKEAEVLAQAIDAAMIEGLDPETSDTLEILARRIAGLGEADRSGNWAMCDAVQLPTSASHLLDLATLEKVARSAAAFQRVEARAQPKRTGGGFQQSRFTRGRGRGRGGGQGAHASESAGQKTSRAGHAAGAAAQ